MKTSSILRKLFALAAVVACTSFCGLTAKATEEEDVEIKTVEITVQPPVLGTSTETEGEGTSISDFNWGSQTNPPEVSYPEGQGYDISGSWWNLNPEATIAFEGTFEANTEYYVDCYVYAEEGYVFAEDVQVTFNGVPATILSHRGDFLWVVNAVASYAQPEQPTVSDGDASVSGGDANNAPQQTATPEAAPQAAVTSPKTGETVQLVWYAVLAASVIGAMGAVVKMRKKEQN